MGRNHVPFRGGLWSVDWDYSYAINPCTKFEVSIRSPIRPYEATKHDKKVEIGMVWGLRISKVIANITIP